MGNCLTSHISRVSCTQCTQCVPFTKNKKHDKNVTPEMEEQNIIEVKVIKKDKYKKHNIYVLGHKDVGKKTFIQLYTDVIDKDVDIHDREDGYTLTLKNNVSHDILIIIYSVCDIESFTYADKLIKNNINVVNNKDIYLMAN